MPAQRRAQGGAVSQPRVHLACVPNGPGLVYAVLWFSHGDDVLGWLTGRRDGAWWAAYFKLEDHLGHQRGGDAGRVLRSADNDLRGRWYQATPYGDVTVPPPVPEDLAHELAMLQEGFVRHWLFFADDPDSVPQAEALRAHGWPVHAVNVRADRLGRFDSDAPLWRYDGHGTGLGVLDTLLRHWPLAEGVEV